MNMSMGRRKEKQFELFIPATQIAKGSGHPFCCRLNQFLQDTQFDSHIEGLCEPYYKEGGRIGIPPGVYFRMLFIGYFEGISSQRGIAWRCADSLALRDFLGFKITEPTPVHASMTIIRQRLPESVFGEVFAFTLKTFNEGGFLKGKAFGVDATTLEANAAMRSIVRGTTDRTGNNTCGSWPRPKALKIQPTMISSAWIVNARA
jgi:transposase